MPSAVTFQVNRLRTRSPAGRAQAGPQLRVVEQAGDGPGQGARVVRRDQEPRLAVAADHLGERPSGGGHHRGPAGHGLDGRQREPLVEGGHHGHLGLAVLPGQLVVADAAHAAHGALEAEPLDGPVDPAARPRFAHDHQLDVALGAELGHRLEQRDQPLHGDVARGRDHEPPGHRLHVGRRANTVWSTPTGTTVMRSGSTPIWATMSVLDDSDTVTMAGSRRATRTCMRRKPNQRRVVNLCQGLDAWSRAS